ncbi:hypothetical protein [Pedobacter panaciterrae]|uniref:hypothetical protein n=1 Tax=Pedobacter panaciterrae TaxID=363849 RepID=UPI00338F3D36
MINIIGFPNSLLWPLFDYFPSFADYDVSFFEVYMAVNEIFHEKLSTEIRQGDVVWIYHCH